MIEELADILLERRIDDREDALAAVRGILERLREPTPEIIAAGERALIGKSNDHWGRAKTAYQAMLSAIDEKEVG